MRNLLSGLTEEHVEATGGRATARQEGQVAGRPGISESRERWPRISLVTPVKNAARYLESAIQSVVSQSYANLEYIIVDGGSTDDTLEIVRRHERHLSWWVTEPDRGMYDAINKGFARSTGEVMGWLSATDMLHVGSLFVVGSVFRAFPEVEWITGIPTEFSEDGITMRVHPLRRWSRARFLLGANRHIQQESTFWRRSLWETAGGYVDASRTMASDFELWVRFFRHAPVHSVQALIGGFRRHADSLSRRYFDEYHRICDEVIAREFRGRGVVATLGRVVLRAQRAPGVRQVWLRVVARALHGIPGPDWPRAIRHDGRGWVMGGLVARGPGRGRS